MKVEDISRAYKLKEEIETIGFILEYLEECNGVDVDLNIYTKDAPHFYSFLVDTCKDTEFIKLFIKHLKAKQDRLEQELKELL